MIEDEYRQKVATIIGCDELDIPVEIDVLEIYNKDVSERKIALVQCIYTFIVELIRPI